MTALAAVVALALPSPTVPGGPGPPGTGLPTAPSDHLRAGQARRTSVGLEELPRAFGRSPEALPAAGSPSTGLGTGLEERWQEALRDLPVVGPFRSLLNNKPVPIPLKALDALPDHILLVYLADERHMLLVHSTPTELRVSVKGIFAVPKALEPGKPVLVGRTPAGDAGEERLVLPDQESWRMVSGTHLKLELVRTADGEPVLVLTHLSETNGTYLSTDQVEALRRSPAGGLEEGAGEEMRFAMVTDDDPLAEVLRKTMTRWVRAHTLRNPGVVILFPRIKRLSEIWKSGDRPPDVVLVGAQVSSDDVIVQMARLTLRLDHVTQRLKGTGAQVGVVFVAPEILHPTLQSLLRHRLDEQRLHSALVTPTLPRPPFREDRGDLGLTGLVYGLANAALDHRRGGLPEGRIFNPKTREFTAVVAALVQQILPEWEFGDRLLDLPRPLALDDGSGYYARAVLAILGEPVPDTTLADLGPPAMMGTPPPDPQPQFVWQLEEAVRSRVLNLDAPELQALAEFVRHAKISELLRHAVLQELDELWRKSQIISLFQRSVDAQQRSELWESLAAWGRSRAFSSDTYTLSLEPMLREHEWSLVITIQQRQSSDLSAWEHDFLSRFAFSLTGAVESDKPAIVGPCPMQPSVTSSGFGRSAELKLSIFGIQEPADLIARQLRLHIEGPGLTASAGLEEHATTTVEQATRTQADTMLDQYY